MSNPEMPEASKAKASNLPDKNQRNSNHATYSSGVQIKSPRRPPNNLSSFNNSMKSNEATQAEAYNTISHKQ